VDLDLWGAADMPHDTLLRAIQSRAARLAVGASTVRGRGNAGVVAVSRSFLRTVDLRAFGPAAPVPFGEALDQLTEELRRRLPRRARHWGIARKVLNIFLRDCLYTTYLEEEYSLRQTESLLELPLDSITVRQLKRAAGRGMLPLWPGVKHLTPALSASFQRAAAIEAGKRNIRRVHLDAIWWAAERDE
jgi:hypothetical protein